MNTVPGLTLRGPKHVASTIRVVSPASPRRVEAEGFIRKVFASRYDARVASFAPELMLLEQAGRITAAAGWRGAASGPLFLEAYLDAPVQEGISRLTTHRIARERIVEVGNLASATPGGGVRMILALAEHLHWQGFEWAVFTATQELISIFTKLGLPPLTLGMADPGRLGGAAGEWGRYYDSRPVVVAGRVRLALDRMQRQPGAARG
jgi:hypothetical protein